LDLSSLASIRKFVEDFNARNLPLNILINNAGTYARKFELSKDGMEKIFATNHIG
jgi:NAD(P)-dependent dehydrogenase (short-subunit alcohol dehydrogenase family)